MTKKVVWIINQYASTPETGIGGRHYYLAEEMATKGYVVYIICASYHHLLREAKEVFSNIEIENRNDNFKIVWIKMPHYNNAHSKKRMLNWLLFSLKIQSLISENIDRPNVILYSSPSLIPFLGARKLAKKLKCKLVFEVRDIWPLTLVEIGNISVKHPLIWLMQKIEDFAYKVSDKVISNLPHAVDHMKIRGLNEEKFVWIPNGLSLKEVSDKEGLSKRVKKLVPKNKFIIGYAGSLGEANALDSLLETASLLKKETGFFFVLVGNGKNKKKLEQKVEALALTNMIFIDAIPKNQIQSMLEVFDVCYAGVKKSKLYHYGIALNKLFDYLYSNKPIIYAIDSGKYKPVEENGAGIQVEPENPEQIKNAIIKFYNMSQGERDRLGANGKTAVIENYEYSKLARKLEKVLFD